MLHAFLCKIAGGVTSVVGQDLRAQDPKNQDPRTQKDLGPQGPRTETPGAQDPSPQGPGHQAPPTRGAAWIRYRETKTMPATPWQESSEEFGARLRGICNEINQKCDVEGLCRKLPERAQAVVDAEGGRIGP